MFPKTHKTKQNNTKPQKKTKIFRCTFNFFKAPPPTPALKNCRIDAYFSFCLIAQVSPAGQRTVLQTHDVLAYAEGNPVQHAPGLQSHDSALLQNQQPYL
jgi:hypothetical protein